MFRFLSFITSLPLPLLGIMVIFGVLGRLFQVGWLESAPDVLMIPTLLAYYLSLIIGVVYGYLKKEDSVYFMAGIGIGVWLIGFLLEWILSFPREIMLGINVILYGVLLVLFILQYRATRKWDERLSLAHK
jgi:uncharacterized membrane protein (UPF0136 family)